MQIRYNLASTVDIQRLYNDKEYAEEKGIIVKQQKSERVKNAVVRKKGKVTKSYKGNKWGRKSLSPQTISKVLELRANGLSMSQICKEVYIYDSHGNKTKNISKGAVHKIVSQNT